MPPQAPAPRRGPSATAIVLGVLAAVLLLGGALAAVVVFAVGQEDDEATTAQERRDGADEVEADGPAPAPDGPAPDGPASDGPATTVAAPAPEPRVPVDAGGGLTWTMRRDPTTGPTSADDPDGIPVRATLWVAEADGGLEGDIAITFELGGRAYSRDDGLRGAVTNSNGVILDGPSDVTIAGRPGRMVVAQIEADGTRAVARYGVVALGDRILLVASYEAGEDAALGQQAFADLVASVSYP